jgi:hypothetical protein
LFRWDKAAALGKRIWGLGKDLLATFQDWRKSRKAAKAAEDAAECVVKKPNSFTPGTLVLMADGTTKKIEEVEIGDEVLATDPKTGETKAETVTAEITGKGLKHLVKVTIDVDGNKGDRTASVTATDKHPFWVPELGEWIHATSLTAGNWLSTSAGTKVKITSVERWTALDATVRNLTVNELHTYYVVVGATPVLVHNCPTGGDDAAEEMVRMRHYTNARGKAGIKQSGIIRASDQNKVFMVPAKGKPWSPRDAESKLGIGRGRGNHVLEFDVPAGRVQSRYNSTMGITEWVADGDIAVTNIRVVR